MRLYLIFVLLINLFSFALFGIDKWCAVRQRKRISEAVLLITTFLGGTFGSLIGMYYFHHKVSKKEFLFKIAVVILVQIALIVFLRYKDHI